MVPPGRRRRRKRQRRILVDVPVLSGGGGVVGNWGRRSRAVLDGGRRGRKRKGRSGGGVLRGIGELISFRRRRRRAVLCAEERVGDEATDSAARALRVVIPRRRRDGDGRQSAARLRVDRQEPSREQHRPSGRPPRRSPGAVEGAGDDEARRVGSHERKLLRVVATVRVSHVGGGTETPATVRRGPIVGTTARPRRRGLRRLRNAQGRTPRRERFSASGARVGPFLG
mmetsp:Transcript_9201/g.29871  ORF Transcript_9201/g.29871 Transcript_9201/m.29871 type:complete len:227 (-) Transcript_9201:1722-2402(-)